MRNFNLGNFPSRIPSIGRNEDIEEVSLVGGLRLKESTSMRQCRQPLETGRERAFDEFYLRSNHKYPPICQSPLLEVYYSRVSECDALLGTLNTPRVGNK